MSTSEQWTTAHCERCDKVVAVGHIEDSAFVFCNIDCLTAHHSKVKGPSRFPDYTDDGLESRCGQCSLTRPHTHEL